MHTMSLHSNVVFVRDVAEAIRTHRIRTQRHSDDGRYRSNVRIWRQYVGNAGAQAIFNSYLPLPKMIAWIVGRTGSQTAMASVKWSAVEPLNPSTKAAINASSTLTGLPYELNLGGPGVASLVTLPASVVAASIAGAPRRSFFLQASTLTTCDNLPNIERPVTVTNNCLLANGQPACPGSCVASQTGHTCDPVSSSSSYSSSTGGSQVNSLPSSSSSTGSVNTTAVGDGGSANGQNLNAVDASTSKPLLSLGAIIAIAIGVVVIVALLFVAYMLRRRRLHKLTHQNDMVMSDMNRTRPVAIVSSSHGSAGAAKPIPIKRSSLTGGAASPAMDDERIFNTHGFPLALNKQPAASFTPPNEPNSNAAKPRSSFALKSNAYQSSNPRSSIISNASSPSIASAASGASHVSTAANSTAGSTQRTSLMQRILDSMSVKKGAHAHADEQQSTLEHLSFQSSPLSHLKPSQKSIFGSKSKAHAHVPASATKSSSLKNASHSPFASSSTTGSVTPPAAPVKSLPGAEKVNFASSPSPRSHSSNHASLASSRASAASVHVKFDATPVGGAIGQTQAMAFIQSHPITLDAKKPSSLQQFSTLNGQLSPHSPLSVSPNSSTLTGPLVLAVPANRSGFRHSQTMLTRRTSGATLFSI